MLPLLLIPVVAGLWWWRNARAVQREPDDVGPPAHIPVGTPAGVGVPTYNPGVRLSDEGRSRVEHLARILGPHGVPVHITSGDRTASEQARVLLSLPNLDAYGTRTREAFAGRPRDLATWTAIVTALQAQHGTFSADHMTGRNADIRVRDLDTRQRAELLAAARVTFRSVGRITNHLHVGW